MRTPSSGLAVADRSGELLFSTAAAQRLLERHNLPPAADRLRRWFAQAATTEPGGVRVDRLPDPQSADRVLLVLKEAPPAASPASLAVLGLTPREAEILFWIAQGKTSPEIAIILASAPATVKRHVHHLLGKLGVETRLAAALKAMEVLGLPGRE